MKSGNEQEKQKFLKEATLSQLFTHSQNIVELLPIYWTKIDQQDENTTTKINTKNSINRYILNVASHLNSTLVDSTVAEKESEPTVQLWVVFMYSPKCGMSRTVRGMVDVAAAHLERNFNIKVGAYACGLYKGFEATKADPIGVKSDPICAQFERKETPNVHVIVETLPGKKFDENGVLVDVPLDPELVIENAKFKHFYAAVPDGNVCKCSLSEVSAALHAIAMPLPDTDRIYYFILLHDERPISSRCFHQICHTREKNMGL